MFFIVGTKSAAIGQKAVHQECSNCHTTLQNLVVFQRRLSVFFIPFLPLGKTAYLECANCKKALSEKEFSPTQKSQLLEQKKSFKTPVYAYAGLILFALLIGSAAIVGKKEEATTSTYASSPLLDDVAIALDKENRHVIFKVVAVEGDVIHVQVGNRYYDSKYEAKKAIQSEALVEPDFFNSGVFTIQKANYQAMAEHIDRKSI